MAADLRSCPQLTRAWSGLARSSLYSKLRGRAAQAATRYVFRGIEGREYVGVDTSFSKAGRP
jgi:hypothetical protein